MDSRRFLFGFLFVILGSMLNYQVAFAQKVKVGPCVKAAPSYSMAFFASEEGNYWAKNGLDAEWVGIRGGAAMARAMAARALHIGVCAPLGQIRAIARGVPELIMADFQSPQYFYLWVRSDSRIKRPMDLKGTKIGVTRLGGSVHAFGMAIAKALGLEKDIKWVAAGGAREEVAALRAGIDDGIIFGYGGMATLRFKGEVREVIKVNDYLPRPWIDLAIFGQREFLNKNPDQARKALKALFQASAFVMRNANWAVKILKEQYRYPEALARQFHRDNLIYGKQPKISRKAVENARDFLTDFGVIPKEKAPSVDDLYSNKFLQ